MAAAMVVASVPKAQGVDIVVQQGIAQMTWVRYEINLLWPLMISLIVNLILSMAILAFLCRPRMETTKTYPPEKVLDADVSDEFPTNPAFTSRFKLPVVFCPHLLLSAQLRLASLRKRTQLWTQVVAVCCDIGRRRRGS